MLNRKNTTLVTISVNNDVLHKIDHVRQNFSRSAYISNVLLNKFEAEI